MQRGIWITAMVLVAAGAGAVRAEPPRLYLSGGIGAGYAPNGSLGDAGATVDFDLGRPVGLLALGLETAGSWRFELEGSYRYNDAEVVYFDDATPDLQPDTESRIRVTSAGVNALYDFDPALGFRPYVGAGVAGTRAEYELTEFITGNRLLDDDDTVWSYQLIAGFGLELSRTLELLVDYRYWRTAEISLETVDGTAFDTRHEVHSGMMSLRYRPFAAAAAGGGRDAPRRNMDAPRAPGWYVRGHGGMSFAKDAEIEDNIANFDAFDVGPVMVLAVGRTLGQRWRLEVEGAVREHEPEIIDFNPEFGEDRAQGDVSARSVMANAIYEPGWGTAFQPYAGLGAGLAWSDWDVRLQANDDIYVDDADSAPALQIMFGAAAPLTERLEVSAEFRYWITGRFDMEQPGGRSLRTELAVNSLMLGLRYRLR